MGVNFAPERASGGVRRHFWMPQVGMEESTGICLVGMLLNILQCMGPSLQQLLDPNADNAC